MKKGFIFILFSLLRLLLSIIMVGVFCGVIIYVFSTNFNQTVFENDKTLIVFIKRMMAFYGIFFVYSFNIITFFVLSILLELKDKIHLMWPFVSLHAIHAFTFLVILGSNWGGPPFSKYDYAILSLTFIGSCIAVAVALAISQIFRKLIPKKPSFN